MKSLVFTILVAALTLCTAMAQTTSKSQTPPNPAVAAAPEPSRPDKTGEDDVQQFRADMQQLKVLLNQMRTNLAFVQTTQTPLKHQFELEVDAWQIVIEQMDRRLKRMEERSHTKPCWRHD